MAPVIEPARAVSEFALLLAAHGERREGAGNRGAFRIARALRDRGLTVAVGFMSGVPTIGDALQSLSARRILVYPLFASSGYFTRDRLVRILDEAGADGRNVEVLPPLGLDPGLPDIVLGQAMDAARAHDFAHHDCTVILLAHGSRRNSASRQATEGTARVVERRAVFRKVEVAFLEQRPSLGEAAASVRGPAIVVGMFSGEGLHGARDAPEQVAQLGRRDVVFGGIMGSSPLVADLVSRAVLDALPDGAESE